jgi:hypothetical protein
MIRFIVISLNLFILASLLAVSNEPLLPPLPPPCKSRALLLNPAADRA